MLKYILKTWQRKPLGVTLIIIGFFIAILFISVGISTVQMNQELFDDKYSGNPEEYFIVHIDSSETVNFSYNEFVSLIGELANYGEVQVFNFGKIELKNGTKKSEFFLVPIHSLETPNWHMPIIEGGYFKNGDFTDGSSKILVGKNIIQELDLDETNKPLFSHEKRYDLTGIVGREYRQTQWDEVAYVPINALPKDVIKDIENKDARIWDNKRLSMALMIRKAKEIDESDIEEIIQSKVPFPIEMKFQKPDFIDRSALKNSTLLTFVIAGVLLIISLVNVFNLSIFWILERKKSLAIMNSIGATPRLIMYLVICEMLLMVTIASLLALLIHKIIWIAFKNPLIQKGIFIDISYVNFFIVIVVAGVCGIISSIIPVRQALKIEPAESLKNE